MDSTATEINTPSEIPDTIPSPDFVPETEDLSNLEERIAKSATDKKALLTQTKSKAKEWLDSTISTHDMELQNRKTRERETNQISTTDYKSLSQKDIQKLTVNYIENLKESSTKPEKKNALQNLISKLNK